MASKSASLRRVQWDNVTSGPSRPAAAQLGDLAAPRRRCAGVGVNPPPGFAGLGPSGGDPDQSTSTRSGRRMRAWCWPTVRAGFGEAKPFAHRSRRGPSARVEMSGVTGDVAPVDHGGDARLERSEQSRQRGGVDVVGRVVAGELGAGRSNRRRRARDCQRWRWVSTNPGITIVSAASTTSALRARSDGPTSLMIPSSISTSPRPGCQRPDRATAPCPLDQHLVRHPPVLSSMRRLT